ncbi:trafficking protein particle complex subunit 4 isoform X1 [Pogona vitticeps]
MVSPAVVVVAARPRWLAGWLRDGRAVGQAAAARAAPSSASGPKGRRRQGQARKPRQRTGRGGLGAGGRGGAGGQSSEVAAAGPRDGHLQRVRGEQGRGPDLPAGPLRAPGRGREDLQLPARAGAPPARRARPGGLRAARRHPRGPRRARPQRGRRQREAHGRREGRDGVPEQPRQLPGLDPLWAPAADLQREAHAGLHVPLALRHRLPAFPRAGELRDRDAGDGHLQAALLPDPDRCELFDQNLKLALEVAEKAGPFGPGL